MGQIAIAQTSAWEDIGNVVRIAPRTASSKPAAKRPIDSDPKSDDECRALRAWAESLPRDAPATATAKQITKHLEFLASTLPTKSVDDDAGKMRFAVYLSMLTGYSDEALAHMSRRVCETLDWFPTPRQCLDLAKEYRAPQTARVNAFLACSRYDQAAFEAWIASIADCEVSLDVPPFWIESALTRALLRKLPNGEVVSRARYRKAIDEQAVEPKAECE